MNKIIVAIYGEWTDECLASKLCDTPESVLEAVELYKEFIGEREYTTRIRVKHGLRIELVFSRI